MPSSGLTSSTYTIGGVRGVLFLRRVAIAMAFSKFFFRCRRDSAVYHATPLHGFPRALGMVGVWWSTKVLPRKVARLQNTSEVTGYCVCSNEFVKKQRRFYCSSGAKAAKRDWCFALSTCAMRTSASMTTMAIKACWLVRCWLVLLPRARGLVF